VNVIQNFIAGLNEGQKKLFVIAVVIVIAALFDRLLIAPTMSRLSSINEDIAKEETTIRQDMRFMRYKDRILRESKEIEPYLTQNVSTDEEMIAAFLRKIESLATQSNVNLIKINPAPGEQDAEYWKYQADLECSGNLADVVTFMHKVNSDKELMKVDKFTLNGKKSDTDDIKASMTVEKIVVTAKPMPPRPNDAHVPSAVPTPSS
jgi:Tfp pilus assembly protein PilO